MSIYETFLNKVNDGKYFKIDFEKRNLQVGKDLLIDNGTYKGDLGSFFEGIEKLEELYREYKFSYPSKNEERKKTYFYAKPSKEMTWEEMSIGEDRVMARAKLEFYVLTMILSNFKWEKSMGSWFWKSSKDQDLVLLKCWFTNEEK